MPLFRYAAYDAAFRPVDVTPILPMPSRLLHLPPVYFRRCRRLDAATRLPSRDAA